MQRFSAVVKKKVQSQIPVLNTYGKPLLVDPSGKELSRDEKTGAYVGPENGTQKVELIATETVADPLTDEAGNVVTAGSPDALLRKVKEHFAAEEFENVEVVEVAVQETLTIRRVSGEELAKL
jgi:hypothetical protein